MLHVLDALDWLLMGIYAVSQVLLDLHRTRKLYQLVQQLHEKKQLQRPYSLLVDALVRFPPEKFYPIFDEDLHVLPCPGVGVQWQIPMLQVIIELGHVLFFTSDIIHAGSGWKENSDNDRVHFYYGHATHELDVEHTVDTPVWCRDYMACAKFFEARDRQTASKDESIGRKLLAEHEHGRKKTKK